MIIILKLDKNLEAKGFPNKNINSNILYKSFHDDLNVFKVYKLHNLKRNKESSKNAIYLLSHTSPKKFLFFLAHNVQYN